VVPAARLREAARLRLEAASPLLHHLPSSLPPAPKSDDAFSAAGTSAGVQVHPDGVAINVQLPPGSGAAAGGSQVTSRLLIDCMGHASPVVRQVRWGRKPDGVCLVVGTLGTGFSDNSTADVIYTNTDLQPLEGSGTTRWGPARGAVPGKVKGSCAGEGMVAAGMSAAPEPLPRAAACSPTSLACLCSVHSLPHLVTVMQVPAQ
jgi:hypothetical protein